jgi:hypothetical protein
MKSQAPESAAQRPFRLAHPPARAAAGVAAAVAIASFAFLVFGPLADQRAFALASGPDTGGPSDAEPPAQVAKKVPRPAPVASAAAAPEHVARALWPGFQAGLDAGGAPP